MNEPVPSPRPASTVVVCRPAPGGFELFLVKRHGRSGFMAGAHVFPGGRVDDDDAAVGARLPPAQRRAAAEMLDGLDEDTAPAYAVAAVRETAEECGLLLARTQAGALVAPHTAAHVVERMRAGTSFADALADEGLVPDVSALSPLAWWITPKAEPKRFDTRFFLAPAPAGQAPRVDEHEATEGAWFTPAAALAAYADGGIRLAPPTLATLEDLAEHDDLERAAAAVVRPLAPIEPLLVNGEDGLILALPGDALHESRERTEKAGASPRRTRIVLDENGRFCSRVVV